MWRQQQVEQRLVETSFLEKSAAEDKENLRQNNKILDPVFNHRSGLFVFLLITSVILPD